MFLVICVLFIFRSRSYNVCVPWNPEVHLHWMYVGEMQLLLWLCFWWNLDYRYIMKETLNLCGQ